MSLRVSLIGGMGRLWTPQHVLTSVSAELYPACASLSIFHKYVLTLVLHSYHKLGENQQSKLIDPPSYATIRIMAHSRLIGWAAMVQ